MSGGEGPGDFDPCECVWSHELATRRLINMIRQQTDYCTENECFTEIPGAPNGEAASTMLIIGFWFLMAIVLFMLRPKTSVPATKGTREEPGPNFDPREPTSN